MDDEGASVTVRISALEATRLGASGGTAEQMTEYVASHLSLTRGGRPCVASATPVAAEAGALRYGVRYRCAARGPERIRSDMLAEVASRHMHVATVFRAGEALGERVLTAGHPTWALSDAAGGGGFGSYVALGAGHLAGGWDHLAFLLGLLFLARSLREMAVLVTGFTLGHSVTLAVAAAGVVIADAGRVETLIALSVILVAVEVAMGAGGATSVGRGTGGVAGGAEGARDEAGAITPSAAGGAGLWTALPASSAPLAAAGALLWRGTLAGSLAGFTLFAICYLRLAGRSGSRWRPAMATAFGLIHGLGFAGALAPASLPAARLVPALLGFNVGIEAGQLAIVLLAWPWVRRIVRRGGTLPLGLAACALAAVGTYALVTRVAGGGPG